MRVCDLMSHCVITCSDRSTLADAARLMWEHDVGFLPVIGSTDAKMAGVITDRDICMAAWLQRRPLADIPVRSAMSQQVAICHPDQDIFEAEKVMRKIQVHRLPVTTREGALLGILSITDMARRGARESDERLEENVAETLAAVCAPREGA